MYREPWATGSITFKQDARGTGTSAISSPHHITFGKE